MEIAIYGELQEVGRTADGMSSVSIQVVPGQIVTVSGISNTLAQEAGKMLFQPVRLTLEKVGF